MSQETEDRPRRGRPRADEVAAIDRRILDAATDVILEHGYGRATMEQVADLARAGKTTLYNRYPTKADLFKAVVTQPGGAVPFPELDDLRAGSVRERLVRAGNVVADVTLVKSSIALMRATLSETESFPEVAQEGFRIGFDACSRHVARALSATDDDADVEAQLPAGRRFVELALHPLYMHAFFGTDLGDLRRRATTDIEAMADYFLSDIL